MKEKVWWNFDKIRKAINFAKNVKVMTSFNDVTIVLTKCEYKQCIALAPSFNLIYWLVWSVIVYSWYNEKSFKKCIKGSNSWKNKYWATKKKTHFERNFSWPTCPNFRFLDQTV